MTDKNMLGKILGSARTEAETQKDAAYDAHCQAHWMPLPCLFCEHEKEIGADRMRKALQRIADGHYKVCHDPFVPVCYCARCIAICALVADDAETEEQ